MVDSRRSSGLLPLIPAMADPERMTLVEDDLWQRQHALLVTSVTEPATADPTRIAYLTSRFLLAIRARYYGDAERCMRALIELEPRQARHYSRLSVTLGRQGRYAEAASAAAHALAMEPNNQHARMVACSWDLALGRREAAMAAFSSIARPTDDAGIALYESCRACFMADAGERGQLADAMAKALKHDLSTRSFFRRDQVFDAYREEPWFVALVGRTVQRPGSGLIPIPPG